MDTTSVSILIITYSYSSYYFYSYFFISRRGQSTVMKGHTGIVRSVRFSNDSRHLITGSNDKLVKVIQKILFNTLFVIY